MSGQGTRIERESLGVGAGRLLSSSLAGCLAVTGHDGACLCAVGQRRDRPQLEKPLGEVLLGLAQRSLDGAVPVRGLRFKWMTRSTYSPLFTVTVCGGIGSNSTVGSRP